MLPAALSKFVVSLIPNFDENKHEVDWNTVLTEGPKAGTTLLWNLASTRTGQALLIPHFGYFKSQKKLDWYTAPEQGENQEKNPLLFLINTREGLKLFSENFDYFAAQKLNWNTPRKKSVLLDLVRSSTGRELLASRFYYFSKQELDWYTTTLNNEDLKITESPLLFLVTFLKGAAFFLSQSDYFISKSKDFLWWFHLAGQLDEKFSGQEGWNLLKTKPQVFLSKDINLNSHPPGHTSFLKYINGADEGLTNWALLCGTSPLLASDIPPEQQQELLQRRETMWKEIRTAIRIIYRDSLETSNLSAEIKELLCMTTFIQAHPELAFVTPSVFFQLIQKEIEICLNEPFNIVATLAVKNFREEKALILDRHHRDLFRENIISALIKYAEKEDSFESLLISTKTLRQFIINAIAKTNLKEIEINEIEHVILTAFQNWKQPNADNHFITLQSEDYNPQAVAVQKPHEEKSLQDLRDARIAFFTKNAALHPPENNSVETEESDVTETPNSSKR